MAEVKRQRLTDKRRSPCPVSCGLDLFGDRWTLLIVRDLFCGRSRFKELAGSPEHIPTNSLSERLSRLIRHGIIETTTSADGSKHLAYQLTSKGRALLPILKAMRDWGLKWQPGTLAHLSPAMSDESL